MMVLPTPQSRDRFYGVFWKRGIPRPNLDFRPRAFCATHGDVAAVQHWKKPGSPGGRYRQQYTYNCPRCDTPAAPYAMPAAAAIDWSIAGQRIGDRAKPLSENTMRRIRLGLERYGPAIVQRFGNTFERKDAAAQYARAWSATQAPIPTMMTDLQHGLVTPLHHGAGGPGARSTDEVWPTQTGRAEQALVGFAPFIAELRGGASETRPTAEPLATICASGNHHGLVTPPGFMVKNYGDGTDPSMSFPFERPLGAVTTMDHHSVVRFDSSAEARGWNDPDWPVDPNAFVSSYYGNGTCSPIRQPLPTVRTHDSAALVNPGIDVEDCSFRMLEPHEVKAAMAFAADYQLIGNKRDQVRQLGNGVTPPVMGMIVGRLVDALEGQVAA
jgi:DNA (cytosine-5)-methyltransferase 1